MRKMLRSLALTAVPAMLAVVPASLAAQTHLLIVSGLGGDPKYTAAFTATATALADAAATRFGIPDAEILWFGEDSVAKRAHYRGASTKANIDRAVAQLAGRSGANDQIVIVLIGHGSGEGDNSRISLPGPDVTARDFATLLAQFKTQRIAFINLTSASGDMLPVLTGQNRVIITATKSAFERNESHFGQYFVNALTKDGADTDKDGRVSLLEAFKYASVETKRLYETDSRLQTEHAQLEDQGEKAGTADPDGKTGQGLLARRFFLDAGTARQAGGNDPRLTALYKDRFALEDQIATLRTKKASMSADAYDDALEQLLVQLARKSRSIREIEGGKS